MNWLSINRITFPENINSAQKINSAGTVSEPAI